MGYNYITWNVPCTTKIFTYDNEKINVTATLVIIVFQVWGIREIWGQLFPIVRKNWKTNVKQNLFLQIFSWMLFPFSFLQKAKGFFCWKTITGAVRTLNLKAVGKPRYVCDGPLPAHFLCVPSTFCSVSRTSARLFRLGGSSWIQGFES